jgi:hypothetical protein
MPAPTKYPDWATDGTNNLEPPTAKTAEGWVAGEEPPASWFNWWKNLVGQWTRWLDTTVNDLVGRMGAAEADLNTLEGEHDALASDAALKSAANTFTQPQAIARDNADGSPALDFSSARSDIALIGSARAPAEHPSKPTNVWKLIGRFKRAGGAYAFMYVGSDPAYGGTLVVTNAYWDVAAQQWNQENAAIASTALDVQADKVVSWTKAAGSGPWTNAQWSAGRVDAGDFVYAPALDRTTFVPLFGGYGNAVLAGGSGSQTGTAAYKLRFTAIGAPAGEHVFPIVLPHGAVLTRIDVLVKLAGAAIMTAKLNRRYNHNFELSGGAGGGAVDQAEVSVGTWGLTGLATLVCNTPPFSVTFDNRADDALPSNPGSEYVLCVIAGTVNDEIHAIRLFWKDPGPRNH